MNRKKEPSPEPQPVDETSRDEFVAAARAATTGVTFGNPLTFSSPGETRFSAAWEAWVDGEFRSVHGPCYRDVYLAAIEGDLRDVLAHDQSYGAALEAGREGSLRAGQNVLDALPGARHVGVLERFRKQVAQGQADGFLPAVLACLAAEFHVGIVPGLLTYAFLEWKYGGGAGRLSPSVVIEEAFANDAVDVRLDSVVRDIVREGMGGAVSPFTACA